MAIISNKQYIPSDCLYCYCLLLIVVGFIKIHPPKAVVGRSNRLGRAIYA